MNATLGIQRGFIRASGIRPSALRAVIRQTILATALLAVRFRANPCEQVASHTYVEESGPPAGNQLGESKYYSTSSRKRTSYHHRYRPRVLSAAAAAKR